MKTIQFFFLIVTCVLYSTDLKAQFNTLEGSVTYDGEPVEFVNIYIDGAEKGATTDAEGFYKITNLRPGEYTLRASYVGFKTHEQAIEITKDEDRIININLVP